jgi:hypothetical protein
MHSSGLPQHSTLHRLDDQLPAQYTDPFCLAMSADNAHIAICYGPKVVLRRFTGFNLQWSVTLDVPGFDSMASVSFQACSFSSDGTSLVVSTQRMDRSRSEDDDTVYTYVWRCEPQPGPPKRFWTCKMPTAVSLLFRFRPSSAFSTIACFSPFLFQPSSCVRSNSPFPTLTTPRTAAASQPRTTSPPLAYASSRA